MIDFAELTFWDMVDVISISLVVGVGLLFWGRGLRRASKADMVAGPIILLVPGVIFYFFSAGCRPFGLLAVICLAFGAASLLMSPLAKTNPHTSPQEVRALAFAAITAALCLSVVL